ncbi:M24 family metallopeptidase [Roseitranquillus sediminis]|uniref:M24 family metallopeptidase n=1 Tax=Roseitranquillus sediminis TaxID=2809051 RepID=UPI001D0C1682|nr:M24 family metallopeptidase [Roseitranquillus sediminis]MBM9593757.1 M24 family metallopeptidase [Roseitranquillus sediminis]
MSDRYPEIISVARQLGVDAVALVPGPNIARLTGHDFMSHERPLLLVVPAEGAPAAIVPNLELGSWAAVGFEGEIFDWRDQDGYAGAFAAPWIMRGNHQELEPGVVFTDEPGLHCEGAFGIRIEDDVLVTEGGCRSLTTFARELRVVG